MDRKAFLKTIFFGGIFLPAMNVISANSDDKRKKIELLQCPIAGYYYYDGQLIENQLNPGTPLRLQREPDNKYDSNAVAVYYKQHKLGFIPRKDNKVIAGMMDGGIKIDASIFNIIPYENEIQTIEIKLFTTSMG